MIAQVSERALAFPGGAFLGPLAHLKGLRPHLVFNSDLLQTLACRIVIVLGTLGGEGQGALPDRFDRLDDLGGQTGEGGRIPLRSNA